MSQDTSTTNSQQELEKIVAILSQMTSRPPAEIKPQIEKFLSELIQNSAIPQSHFFETTTDKEWISAFCEWSESHKEKKFPVLNEAAMSRESMYPDRW